MASSSKTAVPELAWSHAAQDIPERGLTRRKEATPEELARVAAALELLACSRLVAAYTITPSLEGRYRVHGTLEAAVSQACVVTLDPVDSKIGDSFDVTFWPAEEMPTAESGAIDLAEEEDPEPIVAGEIAVGRVVFECLAAAIDPFPRAPGAALDVSASSPPGAEAGERDNPFAVLANIKPKP